jgi:enterochelin esterase-like enzyme
LRVTRATWWVVLAGLCLAADASAQPPAAAPPPRLPPLESPIVRDDRTVTFALRAPNARAVELAGQFVKGPQPMTRDESGVWRITLGPIEPNLYPYNFVVDGLSVADPANAQIFPNERFKASLLDVRGAEAPLYAVQDVPHGELTYATYTSRTLGPRPVVVYTPPGYRAGTGKYPVFYLVSGTTDTEETWAKVGRVHVILDNLIAQKRAVPMVVVMPYGNMMMGTPDPTSLQAAAMYKAFADDLTGSLMPFVEANFRTLADRNHRAIAGFSRGGGQSLYAGFLHLDKFSWIASYSAYLTPQVFEQHFGALAAQPAATNGQLKLLWLGVGRDDFLYKQAVAFDDLLKAKGITHTSLVTDGGHTWMNARHYLADTLQRYFK